MKRFLIVFSSACAFAHAQEAPKAQPVPGPQPVEQPAPEAPARAVSTSGQFSVTGGDGPLRSSVAMLAEQTKKALLDLSETKDDAWKTPIAIVLHGKPGDPVPARSVAFDLSYNEKGFVLRLDLHLARGLDQERFEQALLAAVLYEQTLRQLPPGPLESPLVVPPWLVVGLRETIAWREKRSDRRLYETLFKHGGLYKLDELFAVTDPAHESLDSAMRAAFRVSSGALVMALFEQPQGKEGFRAFLGEAASFDGEMPQLLRKHFPELNLSERSLAKWWQLQMANMAAPQTTDVLTVVETDAALSEALKLHFREAEGGGLDHALNDWGKVAKLSANERIEAVRPAQDALVRLSYRCFPSHRPLIAGYQTILNEIAANKPKKIDERLAKLAETRQSMNQRIKRAQDFLEWFEITRARETSGAFEDYLALKDRLKANTLQRTDPVSNYLDRLDKVFDRSKEPSK
ncbi:MAG TPA: hypothetical protein VIM57_10745 [Luteolibacter sp.]